LGEDRGEAKREVKVDKNNADLGTGGPKDKRTRGIYVGICSRRTKIGIRRSGFILDTDAKSSLNCLPPR
jgi:hypothetical protein